MPASRRTQASADPKAGRQVERVSGSSVSWLQQHVFIALWVAPFATLGSVLLAIFLPRIMDWLQRPRLRIEYNPSEPFVRSTLLDGEPATWQRLKVTNAGRRPARRCIGMMTRVRSAGEPRHDIDPVQLRWAGVPRHLGFEGIDLGRDEYAFLDLLMRFVREPFARIQTFEDSDFDPGFGVELSVDGRSKHRIAVTVTSDSADPATIEVEAVDSPSAQT